MSEERATTQFLRKLIESVTDSNVRLEMENAGLRQQIVKLQLRCAELTEIVDEADYALELTAEVLMQGTVERIQVN